MQPQLPLGYAAPPVSQMPLAGQPSALAMPQPMYNPMASPIQYATMPMQYATMPMQPPVGWQQASYGGPPQPLPSMSAAPMHGGHVAGGAHGSDHGYGGGGGCANCGGGGCGACAGYGAGYGSGRSAMGMLDRVIAAILPYGEGGPCAPRWYDIYLDGMYLKRADAARGIDLSSDGIAGDILLSTSDLDFTDELGFRITGSVQAFAGTNVEFSYFGLFNWTSAATNRAPQFEDDIFSVLSEFGVTPFNGFDETDRARQHTIGYSSTVDSFELHFRRRFTAPNCRVQCSWLLGARYVYLLEDFEHFTLGGDDDPVTPGLQTRGFMDYDIASRNSLVGFQAGTDLWVNVVPGINIGAEVKAGVYGNYANQSTNILATTTSPMNETTYDESVDGNDLAMVAEGNLTAIYRLNPHWTLRVGYNIMFLEGVALAAENFNTTPPNILTTGPGFTFPPRIPTINDNGNVLYHGGYGGFEWMW
jgi:hypothetical protein